MKTDVRRPTVYEDAHPDRAPSTVTGLDYAGIACLAAVMAIHTSELSGKTEEVAYLGFGYVLLIAAALVSVVLLAQHHHDLVAQPLPSHDDVGNWSETIAIWALVAEGLMVVLSVVAIRRHRQA